MTLDDPNCRNCFRFSLLVEFGSRSIISEYMIGSFSGIDDCCEIELRCITQGMLPWQPMLCCTECSSFAAQCWNSCIPPLCQNRSKQLQQLHSQMQYVHLRATNTERPQNLPLCKSSTVCCSERSYQCSAHPSATSNDHPSAPDVGRERAGDSPARRPIHHAPPVEPPIAIHWPSPDVSGALLPAMLTDCPQAATGVWRWPGTASGGCCRSPPLAPSGDPTLITPSVGEYI